MTSFLQLLYLLLYFFLFMGLVGGLIYLKHKQRKVRSPVAFKLLRGPGESLRKQIAQYEENIVFHLLGAAFVPLAVLYGLMLLVVKLGDRGGSNVLAEIAVAGILVVISFYLSIRWFMGRLELIRNHHLGYLGEREVAEHLVSLGANGYRIFHDVPAESGGRAFNLDHVAVGPGGVAMIEVKTRRKGRAREGCKDHVVTFDGRQLIWPWGEDSHEVAQCAAEAVWLQNWIKQRTGIETPVKPVLALPGWYVERKARGEIVVVNSKTVASAVEGRDASVLTPEQIDLIARQLDVVCRDVEE